MTRSAKYLILLAGLALPCAAASQREEIRLLQAQLQQLTSTVSALQARVRSLEQAPSATVMQIRQEPMPPPVRETAKPAPAAPSKFAMGGDFRLYFDSITRPAGGGAPRVSNIRGRYLLHLDLAAQMHRTLSIHARLSTGPLNNPLTDIQDFGGGLARHSLMLSEAYVDYHPNARFRFQGGRVDNVFNDRSAFLFDQDSRFNGTNESFTLPGKIAKSQVKLMAGQYTFTHPNFPEIVPGTSSTAATATPSQAFLAAGAKPGTQPRASQLFQQGALIDTSLSDALTQQAGFDLQLYRNPNQLRLMSTAGGLFLVGGSIGFNPVGPVPSPGNATTTPGGAEFTAPGFRIGHLTYTLAHRGLGVFDHSIPMSLNMQMSRNFHHVSDRNGFAIIGSAGRSREAGDLRLQYAFYRKQANALIGEVTENDIGIGGNVNMQANSLRIEYTLHRGVIFANNIITTKWLKDSNPQARFFVPFGATVPLQFRYQSMLLFRF
ncbi:MAG TPA: putative porin [Bryobacteraceae bacterium]|nr:putative porin [Bryobacteraceae bacterium]